MQVAQALWRSLGEDESARGRARRNPAREGLWACSPPPRSGYPPPEPPASPLSARPSGARAYGRARPAPAKARHRPTRPGATAPFCSPATPLARLAGAAHFWGWGGWVGWGGVGGWGLIKIEAKSGQDSSPESGSKTGPAFWPSYCPRSRGRKTGQKSDPLSRLEFAPDFRRTRFTAGQKLHPVFRAGAGAPPSVGSDGAPRVRRAQGAAAGLAGLRAAKGRSSAMAGGPMARFGGGGRRAPISASVTRAGGEGGGRGARVAGERQS